LKELNAVLTEADAQSVEENGDVTISPRISPLDNVPEVVAANRDLRTPRGKLSADRVVKVYGITLSQLAKWIGRTKQSVSKTPDADSLQPALGYFERVARLRAMTADADFRKWLRTPQSSLDRKSPLDVIAAGEYQVVADLVDDMLTGSPG
jgi:hypothetical protein